MPITKRDYYEVLAVERTATHPVMSTEVETSLTIRSGFALPICFILVTRHLSLITC